MTPTPTPGYVPLAVRAAHPDAEEKAAVWQTLVVDRKVPIGPFNQVSSAFWRPGQGEVLAPYADKYLDLLPTLDQGGMILAMVYTNRLFPVFGIDESYIARAEKAAESCRARRPEVDARAGRPDPPDAALPRLRSG